MNNKPNAVPLVEQLRSVPADAVLRIDTPNALGCMDTRSIPVGRLCHEAAAARTEEVRVLREALTKLMRHFPTDIDMAEAGWTFAEIEQACQAHDAACAALEQTK